MTPIILAILAAVAVGAAGFALVPALFGGGRADKRIKALQGDVRANRATADAVRNRDTRRKELQQTLRAQTAALEKKKKLTLRDRIFQAGMRIKPADFIRNSVIVGVVVFVLSFVLHHCQDPLTMLKECRRVARRTVLAFEDLPSGRFGQLLVTLHVEQFRRQYKLEHKGGDYRGALKWLRQESHDVTRTAMPKEWFDYLYVPRYLLAYELDPLA